MGLGINGSFCDMILSARDRPMITNGRLWPGTWKRASFGMCPVDDF